ncbi:hypothetical protein SAMN04488239_1208 [Ruegeria marina]|uniref:Uncharacterized protein n=1 Tax=Ruegeria marina TaxID=639004 RepID=A0A1G7D3A7_9RHOB|nr:hypothetical protein SAMN04488239_1208 [Ruegeria marina]
MKAVRIARRLELFLRREIRPTPRFHEQVPPLGDLRLVRDQTGTPVGLPSMVFWFFSTQ